MGRISISLLRKAGRVLWSRIQAEPYLIAALFLAALMRFPGSLHGLPSYYDADEPIIIKCAVSVVQGELNPHFFTYPSLLIYFSALIIGIFQLVSHACMSLGILHADHTPYWMFFAIMRIVNVFLSTGAVVLVYMIGRRIMSSPAAGFCALFMAVIPIAIEDAARVVPTSLTMFVTALCIYFSISYVSTGGKKRFLFLSAAAVGLALGSKYLLSAPLTFFAGMLLFGGPGKDKFWWRDFALCCGLMVATFIITTPFSVLSFEEFIGALFYQRNAYSSGHPGAESDNALAFFGSYLFNEGATPLVFIVSLAGIVLLVHAKWKESVIIAVAPVVWFVYLGIHHLTFIRNIVIIAIPLSLFAGFAVSRLQPAWLRALVLPALMILPVKTSVFQMANFCKTDIRYVAQEWIYKNIPEGSTLAMEEYTPILEEKKYRRVYKGICGLAYSTPDLVLDAGYDYLVSASHERFDQYPEKYARERENYSGMLSSFPTIAYFEPGNKYRGQAIRIQKVIRRCGQEGLQQLQDLPGL